MDYTEEELDRGDFLRDQRREAKLENTQQNMQFTIEQVDDALRQVILAKPHFTYSDGKFTSCYYHQGPSTNTASCDGCVFGQAFQFLGVKKDVLAKSGSILTAAFPFLPPEEERPSYWRSMQTDQDSGREWGGLLEHLPTTK